MKFRYISLITGSDLRMVMGVNYFLKSFIKSNIYFHSVKVNRVYSGIQTLKVDEGNNDRYCEKVRQLLHLNRITRINRIYWMEVGSAWL